MKNLEQTLIGWFLRIALSAGMFSAVADRFGLWNSEISAWGTWERFVVYTQQLNPWIPASFVGIVAGIATLLEIVFAMGLLIPFKTSLIARATGFLLLAFGLAMTFFINIKAPLDYSVFVGASGAFALSILVKKANLS